ncbi:hypothetical protein M2145_000547 [Lachnospiraceae bacterium PF1-21]|uniref:hypothetical protein n=1 Tax=Ohessyouella blattaphilus TaxID=2949333 RepID=UPI003E29BACD
MRFRRIGMGVLLALGIILTPVKEAEAAIASDAPFEGVSWELAFEQEMAAGIVQSLCVTRDYIVTLENVNDEAGTPDILRAYEKKAPYNLAISIDTMNFEHCNGMAYNPQTEEIVVALYTAANPENRGCLFVMDANSFELKEKVKIADDYNILGIDYDGEQDRYIIQTNSEGGYSFKILTSDFQIAEDLGEYAHTAKGDNFQDLCVSGDYIINFPLTLGLGIGDYMNVYSISRKEMVSSSHLDFGFEGVTWDEPESLCEISPGKFMAVVNVKTAEGKTLARYYQTTVPYNYEVKVVEKTAEEEELKTKAFSVLGGEGLALNFTEHKGYHVEQVLVGGKPVELDEDAAAYKLSSVSTSQVIEVIYGKSVSLVLVILGILVAFFVISTGLLLYYRHLQIIRRRKLKRARKMRYRLQQEQIMI